MPPRRAVRRQPRHTAAYRRVRFLDAGGHPTTGTVSGYAPAMTNTTSMRLVIAAGILAVVGGVLSVAGGAPQGWVAIICGLVIAGVGAVELRRPRP